MAKLVAAAKIRYATNTVNRMTVSISTNAIRFANKTSWN
jgi:hypothetical protein